MKRIKKTLRGKMIVVIKQVHGDDKNLMKQLLFHAKFDTVKRWYLDACAHLQKEPII